MILSRSLAAYMDQDAQKGQQLLKEIKSFLEFAQATQKKMPSERIFVWKTSQSNLYYCTKEERSVDEAIDAMKSRNDTQAVLFTCMFGENAYDYPSAYFRDSLLQLNPKNEDAQFICFTLSSEPILK